MKKILTIIIVFSFVFVLTACSKQVVNQDSNVINLDSGVDYNESEVADRLGFALPEDAVVSTTVNNADIYLVEVQSQMSVEELVQFFTAEMKTAGYTEVRNWEALTEQENTQGAVFTRKDKPLSFSIRSSDNLRSISIQQTQ